jgi:hypothetical protein
MPVARVRERPHVQRVITSLPPYAVQPTQFRFAALAALAGRAAIGGQREVALATYMAARLADDVLPDHELDPDVRQERAGAAKHWLSSVALPAQVKPALVRLVEASNVSRAAAAAALLDVITVTASHLDKGARSELEQLAKALERH